MTEGAESELEYLRAECDRLRKERDLARKDRQDAEAALESESSIRLKFLAEGLSREVKDRFLVSLKTALWAATLLLGIATAGGLWKLSDIVTARVDEKIKEKEQDVAQLRHQVIKAVVDFERQAQKSLEDIERLKTQVATESHRAAGEIQQAKARILSLEISSPAGSVTVSAAASEGSPTTAWFGGVTNGVVAVSGSQADQYSFEDPKNQSGAFSFRFRSALQDRSADANQDGYISISEAATSTAAALSRDGFDQAPTVVGAAAEVALFASGPAEAQSKRYKRLYAVIVGVNEYSVAGSNLKGAVADAQSFATLLKRDATSLFEVLEAQLLTDRRATTQAIKKAIADLRTKATKDDLVLFYYSGHTAIVGKDADAQKVIYPTDGDLEQGTYLRVNEIVEGLGAIGAKQGLFIIDG